MSKIELSIEQIDLAKSYYASGMSFAKIGSILGFKYNTIRRILLENGAKPRRASETQTLYNINTADQSAIIEAYLANKSLHDIHLEFKLSIQNIKYILSLNNIKIRNQSECTAAHQHCNNLSEKEINDITTAYLAGQALQSIKKIFHINAVKLKEILTTNGVTLRTKQESLALRNKHSEQTCLERYGVAHAVQTEAVREKIKQTNLERYGVVCTLNDPSIKQRAIQTTLEHFGVQYSLASKEVQAKGYASSIAKYGYIPGRFGSMEHDKAMLEKYGRLNYTSTTIYHFNEQYFDSFPELAFYLYYFTQNIVIEREPIKLVYTYNNLNYNYVPDFRVNNQLYEIKGNQFVKEDGTWQNPYDHTLDALFEAKHQCALSNNVKILYQDDYKFYIDWFSSQGHIKNNYIISN